MAAPFVGEIRIMSFPFPPKGWAQCDGQLLAIQQNQALFAILGTMYGGNGVSTFMLPDLRGKVPIHVGPGFLQGQTGGEENHTLVLNEIPAHVHSVNASTAAPNAPSVEGNFFSNNPQLSLYQPTSNATLEATAVGAAGSGLPHQNMQPYTTLNFCIALQGVFPSRP